MLHVVEDPQHDEYQRRFAQAQAEYDYRRARMPNQHYCDWFTMETDRPTRKIPDLEGPWAKDIDASKTNIVLAGRLDIPEASDHGNTTTPIVNSSTPLVVEESESWDDDSAEYEEYGGYQGSSGTPEIEILLQSENDILAHRYRLDYWNSSQVIVVANGSFLLNMPLVEKEHRKLAGKLIAECGPAGRVAFLESGPAGVRVQKSNLAQSNMFAHRILTVWPISFIVIQFAVLGITFCIAMFPIFGRPQHLREESRSDFGQHVAALGELLHKTKDTFFAQSKIRQYQAIAKRGSGQSHRENLPQPLAASVLEQPQPNS